MATTDTLPLTTQEEEQIKHFLLVYERGFVPPDILKLAAKIPESPEGQRIHELQRRATWRARQALS